MIEESWLKISLPTQNKGFSVIQQIGERNEKSKFDLISNLDLGAKVWFSFLTIVVISLMIKYCLYSMQQSIKKSKKIKKFKKKFWHKIKKFLVNFIKISFKQVSTLSVLGFFVVFFDLFLWLSELMITNNIKTNTVVLDLSNIIQDENDAFRTKKVLCLLSEDTEHKIGNHQLKY